jgi:uncharacterized protein (TIGR03790 family)
MKIRKVQNPAKHRRVAVFALLCVIGIGRSVQAGGGGQNLLLAVNPDDEQQVRIAAEYQRLRHIPDCNIVFLKPQKDYGFYKGQEDLSSMIPYYLTPIYRQIVSNNLVGQIDYIATLGMPFRLDTSRSFQYLAGYLDGLVSSSNINLASGNSRYIDPSGYSIGSNAALYQTNDGQYVSTTLGFTGLFGNSPSDIISNLQRTAGADGSKPAGTVYFEENDNVRSNIRESQWPVTKSALGARSIGYLEERGSTPMNRSDVRGAVIGASDYSVPNGSTYLPGSWADSLTSYGCDFWERSQTKAAELIRAGVGGSGGTVTEPGANYTLFPNSHIFVYLADGSTLGEAFYRSVQNPFLQTMLGDPLGQPYADIPGITLVAGPQDEATVSGTVVLTATASLSSPALAAGIQRIDLYVDGKYTSTMTNSGTFNLNTSALSDGNHELRIVAVNNAAAESQAVLFRNVTVNNSGRSVRISGGDLDAGTQSSIAVPVTSEPGSGSVSRIELRNLGRVVGQLASGAGNVTLDVTRLAYGTNTVIPVAVFSDGAQVAGTPVQVRRDPVWLPGTAPLLPQNRGPGILGEYFVGQGGDSISISTFSGTPSLTKIHSRLLIGVYSTGATWYTQYGTSDAGVTDVERHPIGSTANQTLVDRLSARYSGRFETTVAGEYNFFFYKINDSARLLIDGQNIMEYNNAPTGAVYGYGPSVFLAKGEHTLELLTANRNTGTHNGYYDIGLYVRGPDGLTKVVDDTMIYQFGLTVLDDNFESYTVGNSIGGTNGWADINKTPYQGFTTSLTNSNLSSGSQALHFSDADSSAVSNARIQNVFSKSVTSMVVTFDFMAVNASRTPIFTIRGKTFDDPASTNGMVSGDAGRVMYYDGTVWRQFNAGLTLNTWYHFKITIKNDTSGTFDLVVSNSSGEVVNQEGLSFGTAASGLTSMDFSSNNGAGTIGGDYYIDNVRVSLPSTSRYAVWASGFGLAGGPNDDDDSDGLLNIYEYGLGGNPTNSLDVGYQPVHKIVEDGGTNRFEYVYMRSTVADNGLAYRLELNNDLMTTNWISGGYLEMPDAGLNRSDFEAVTNLIEMTDDKKFIRLRIISE